MRKSKVLRNTEKVKTNTNNKSDVYQITVFISGEFEYIEITHRSGKIHNVKIYEV